LVPADVVQLGQIIVLHIGMAERGGILKAMNSDHRRPFQARRNLGAGSIGTGGQVAKWEGPAI
jgi:hypothetical protein